MTGFIILLADVAPAARSPVCWVGWGSAPPGCCDRGIAEPSSRARRAAGPAADARHADGRPGQTRPAASGPADSCALPGKAL
jgi:hypothetical protein